MLSRLSASVSLFLCSLSCFAQLIDNAASYRNISSDRYFRIHYENDYFSETDEFYTQGINLELVHPSLARFPLSKLLIRYQGVQTKNGVAIEHLGFTPTSILHDEILTGDRPFAAALFLKTFSVLNDTLRRVRISSSLSTGIIGPAAGGQEMQATIHRWIGDRTPHGWQHQIQNDLVLNYQADIEKQLLALPSLFLLTAKAGAMAGTLSDKAYASFTLTAGWFDSPFRSFLSSQKNFQASLYFEPRLNVVAYDASLQGGVFNKSSYTIPAGNLNRLVYQHQFGAVFKIRKVYLEYFQSFMSREFSTQGVHRWGGIRIGFGI